MLERYLVFWLGLLSLAAYRWSDWFAAVVDPFTWSAPYLKHLIAMTMFAIGWMLPRDEVNQVVHRWPTVLAGTGIQFVTMPLLAYGMGRLWQLEGEQMIGIVMVGCVPGAMASNVLTLVARGNASYSVSLTTTATLLSPLVVPLTLRIALIGQQGVDPLVFLKSAGTLLVMVVLPVIAGHLASRGFPDWQQAARKIGSTIANLAILWIIAVVIGLNRDKLQNMQFDLLWALVGVNLGGYAAGYLGGCVLRVPDRMRRALTLEIGMQNAGLGATLAADLFGPAAAIAPAVYTFGCMLTGTVLARLWAGYSPRTSPDSAAEVPPSEA